jgi:hypothetical protein
MAEALRHPIVLTLAAFLLTGLIAPLIVQRAQDGRRKSELRAELAERIVSAVEAFTTAGQFAHVRATSQSQGDLDAAYRQWLLDEAVLGTLLEAYYLDEEMLLTWTRVRALATSYYVRLGIRGETDQDTAKRRQRYLAHVEKGIVASPPYDASQSVTHGPEDVTEPVLLADAGEHLTRVRAELTNLARQMLTARMR